jgi:hypothetical protein
MLHLGLIGVPTITKVKLQGSNIPRVPCGNMMGQNWALIANIYDFKLKDPFYDEEDALVEVHLSGSVSS